MIGSESAPNLIVNNQVGVSVRGTPSGSQTLIVGNSIYANNWYGIECVYSHGINVLHNRIGSVQLPETGSDNARAGIHFLGTLGAKVFDNEIAGNSAYGIDSLVAEAHIERNAIYQNTLAGIAAIAQGVDEVAPPVLSGVAPVAGSAEPGARVALYVDDEDEGAICVGVLVAESGIFSAPIDLSKHIGKNLTATAWNGRTTSVFSLPLPILDPFVLEGPLEPPVCPEPDGEEGELEGELEGNSEYPSEGEENGVHTADINNDFYINISELLRIIQLYNQLGFRCAIPPDSTEDGFVPGVSGPKDCAPHDADIDASFTFNLGEVLRMIQLYVVKAYHYCPDANTEDGFCV